MASELQIKLPAGLGWIHHCRRTRAEDRVWGSAIPLCPRVCLFPRSLSPGIELREKTNKWEAEGSLKHKLETAANLRPNATATPTPSNASLASTPIGNPRSILSTSPIHHIHQLIRSVPPNGIILRSAVLFYNLHIVCVVAVPMQRHDQRRRENEASKDETEKQEGKKKEHQVMSIDPMPFLVTITCRDGEK